MVCKCRVLDQIHVVNLTIALPKHVTEWGEPIKGSCFVNS